MLKSRKRKHLLTVTFILIGLAVSCGLMYICLLKFYLVNKYNVYARKVALDSMNGRYRQEFELLSTEFETKEIRAGVTYIHKWTFTFRDSEGRQFYTFVWIYGGREKGEGLPYHPDYYPYIDDTYGQLCIEEKLGDKYDLYKYRQDRVSRFPDGEDYIFICTKDNAEEIAEMLTEIYFAETEFSNNGGLYCRVNDEDGEKLFSYFWSSVTRNLQKQNKEITKETVYAYILQEIQN